MNTNFEHYRIFYYVAKYGNLTKAATVLHTSQPSVTRTIHNLEKNLNCRLFERSKVGMKLTPEGEVFYEYIAAGCAQFFKGENNLSNLISLENGTITSGGKSKSDKPLMQYRVTYGGQGTDIYVGN